MKLTFVPLQRRLALVTGNVDLCASSAISQKEFLNHTCSQDQAAMTVYTAPLCGDDNAVGPHNEDLTP